MVSKMYLILSYLYLKGEGKMFTEMSLCIEYFWMYILETRLSTAFK